MLSGQFATRLYMAPVSKIGANVRSGWMRSARPPKCFVRVGISRSYYTL